MRQNKTNAHLQAGRWSKEEHKRFVEALKMFGKDWKKVKEYVVTRSGS
jgi:SHAQKYF class myb-like DNA-binding protein